MSRKAVFVLLPVILISMLLYHSFNSSLKEKDKRVRASGTVEVTEVRIAPRVGGKLVFFELKDGEYVEAGELICKISHDGLDSEVAAKTAALEQAKARYKELKNGNRPEEILQGGADLKAKELLLEQAERDADRYAELLKDDLVSKSDAERYRKNADIAAEAVNAAKQKYTLLQKGTREEQLTQQLKQIEQLSAALEVAETQLSFKEIYSPAAGIVLSKNFERGEIVVPGAPIVNIGVMDDIWVKVYIPATQLSQIKTGLRADIFPDGFDKKPLIGFVRAVAQQAEFNPRLSLTQRERENQVFWVKVGIVNDYGIVKPGMPVDVVFALLPEESR